MPRELWSDFNEKATSSKSQNSSSWQRQQPTGMWGQAAFGYGGGVLDDQILLKGIEPRKAFDNLVKEREKAKI